MTPDAARTLRRELKTALTEVASGRAGVASLLHEVERIAQYASGRHQTTLRKAAADMRTLVGLYAPFALQDAGLGGMGWDRLYEVVKDARNDIAHTGTEAVLAGARTKALAAVLLEALLGLAVEDEMRFAEVMVVDPVCAHGWQTVADVRRTLLVTDFSELPLAGGSEGGKWRTVTARGLAVYLGSDEGDRWERMGRTIDEALVHPCRRLRLYPAPTAAEDAPVREIWNEDGERSELPLMVTRQTAGGPVLVGIVTAFDLL